MNPWNRFPRSPSPRRPRSGRVVRGGNKTLRWFCLSLVMLPGALTLSAGRACALGGESYVRFEKSAGAFPLAASGTTPPLCISSGEDSGVVLILKAFQEDIALVTGTPPEIVVDKIPSSNSIVLVGTLGRSPLIDRLVKEQKLDARRIAGQWETSLIQVVANPCAGVQRALVIAGSDKRGTMYGMFDISERIGVSPWYWWADVPVRRHKDLFILPGRHTDGPPSVKYRGIFLNDEWPDLTNWIKAKYGAVTPKENPPIPPGVANYGHEFYVRIFELLLRLKANYLWPAMWNNAFNEDDPENPRLANAYGIVMGTSHQEPMLRAQKEWDRRYLRTLGAWNYAAQPDVLASFWRDGIRRNKNDESIITIGLRGANDTPMAPGGPEANMALLEKIVGVQRKIIAEEMNPDVTKVPQLWCLYKEVLDFYNAGMRVPDDVTLLWPDDNWGNNRRLPTAEERKRSGGAGIYYHFDYHGGPRSYQWINTNPIAKVWEQMSLAKDYGADRIWIVNVGHFKGYEFPIEYFLNLAWNTRRWTGANIQEYTRLWAEREFGPAHAADIADVIAQYTRYNGRRKPELLGPQTYSLVNYQEAESVVEAFKSLTAKAERINGSLSPEKRNAFYELVLFPTKASTIVNELYLAAGKNALYARQGRSMTNAMAEETRSLFVADTALMGEFNRTLAGGKWDHFMDQTHLGYTNWQDPPSNSLGAIPLTEISVPLPASIGVAVEGSEDAWPGTASIAALPRFDPYGAQRHSLELFNRGKEPFGFTTEANKAWLRISESKGTVDSSLRLWVSVDWSKTRRGVDSGTIQVTGTGSTIPVRVNISNPGTIASRSTRGFIEGDGYVSIEAEHFTGETSSGSDRWVRIEGYGQTLSGMRTTSLPGAPPPLLSKRSPCLEYRMYLTDTGNVAVEGIFGPSLNFLPGRDVRYGISFDDRAPELVTLLPQSYSAQNGNKDWERSVILNTRSSRTTHHIRGIGWHTLKIWMVDPGVVLEKIIVDFGGVRPSALGPPESSGNLQ